MTSAADAAGDSEAEPCQLANEDYTVGWICALTTEHVAAQVFLDQKHASPAYIATHDNNDYTLGRIGKHNVVIAVLPGGEYGTASAAGVARDLLHTFTNVRIGLMVGIGGGAPTLKHDIRLGDVVVSEPQNGVGGVLQYDFGKNIQDQPFQSTRFLASPPPVLLTTISGLKAHYEINGHTIQEIVKACLASKKRLQKNGETCVGANTRAGGSVRIQAFLTGEKSVNLYVTKPRAGELLRIMVYNFMPEHLVTDLACTCTWHCLHVAVRDRGLDTSRKYIGRGIPAPVERDMPAFLERDDSGAPLHRSSVEVDVTEASRYLCHGQGTVFPPILDNMTSLRAVALHTPAYEA
ncbi:hypothetical protein NLG97_g1029 [Lecanicillium saksenae]|uniref:Uncharacterized protein n=1 Tax=Lecanicillium saksenae TaxID=468837 RepID=A0ACC1R8A8_9HYPO|nr:hypothetical protein NLG97_g1029 [Lecanicillium saksenae]